MNEKLPIILVAEDDKSVRLVVQQALTRQGFAVQSIGTAAAVGFLIALSGSITMIIGGKIINNVNTPFSLGYINLLGFLVFVPVTMIMARLGAKAVYKIDKKILSKIFGTFLIIVSIRSFIEYLNIN